MCRIRFCRFQSALVRGSEPGLIERMFELIGIDLFVINFFYNRFAFKVRAGHYFESRSSEIP